MTFFILGALTLMLLPAAEPDRRKPDNEVEITTSGGKPALVEKGKDKPGPVVVVVGQTLRWVNRDGRAHHLVSVAEVDGKPVLDLGLLKPGESRDLVIDNELYRRAGGKTASVVTITFRSREGKADAVGELQILSPAKRRP